MKATVIRSLQGGVYYVAFSFSDFTPEELAKMRSFGVPTVQIRVGVYGQQTASNIQITQINANHVAGFTNQPAAEEYQASILGQVKSAMEALRQKKDEFTATAEVDI
jgi:hypothetical protein